MIATKSYVDTDGNIHIDGEPLKFHRRPQNLKASPSRHRKFYTPEQAYIRSFKDAAASIIVLMVACTAIALVIAFFNN